MSASTERAAEIVTALTAVGIRATTDPSAAIPPAVLVPPPGRTWDVGCGWSARWELAALATAPTGADHTSWAQLDDLIDGAVAAKLPLETAQLVSYSLAGTEYPAYLLVWNEAISEE